MSDPDVCDLCAALACMCIGLPIFFLIMFSIAGVLIQFPQLALTIVLVLVCCTPCYIPPESK